MPRVTVGEPQAGHLGLQMKVKKERLNHLHLKVRYGDVGKR